MMENKSPDRLIQDVSNDRLIRADDYDVVQHFVSKNGTFPNSTFVSTKIEGNLLCYEKIMKLFLEEGAKVVFKSSSFGVYAHGTGVRKVYLELMGDLFIFDSVVYKSLKEFTNVSDDILQYKVGKNDIAILNSMAVLHKDFDMNPIVEVILRQCFIKPIVYPTVNIISRDQDGFFLNPVRMDSSECGDLNLHYGEGFQLFHDKLVTKLTTTNQGLTLLHGDPGTGKSFYINRLISDLHGQTGKKIILVPNTMINYLTDPDFNTFLLETADSVDLDLEFQAELSDVVADIEAAISTAEKGMILILEDAESVLMKRNGHDSGTSNILNLTSGLLNKIFGTQIIATYNTKDDNIDPAIMRNKRLIAKHDFAKLSIEQSQCLAKSLNLDSEMIKTKMTVADIYSLLDEEEDLVLLSKKPEKKKIGFNKC